MRGDIIDVYMKSTVISLYFIDKAIEEEKRDTRNREPIKVTTRRY